MKYYWEAWNTEVGTNCIDDYEVFVTNSNLAAKANGFEDRVFHIARFLNVHYNI